MFAYTTYRYIIPPFILVTLVSLAAVFSPSPFELPSRVTEFFRPSDIISVITLLLAAGAFILAFGFFISTIPVFITRIVAFLCRKPRGFSMCWNEEARNKLSGMYTIKNFNTESEQLEQVFIGQFASQHVRGWMRGRWEYYIINTNCAFSALLAIVFVCILSISPPLWWWVTTPLFFGIFLFNGLFAWREVIDMDHFLVRNHERICTNLVKSVNEAVEEDRAEKSSEDSHEMNDRS